MTANVPVDYADTLDRIKGYVRESRYIAQHRVNTELLRLYWRIGATLNERNATPPGEPTQSGRSPTTSGPPSPP